MLWGYDIFNEMDRMRRAMDGLLSTYVPAIGSATFPLVNVYDDKDNVVVTAELPGLTRERVNITFSDNTFTIAGKLEPLAQVKNMTPVRKERSEGSFEKTIRIPTKVDQNALSATFSNGILTITMPKTEEAKPKTISIEAK